MGAVRRMLGVGVRRYQLGDLGIGGTAMAHQFAEVGEVVTSHAVFGTVFDALWQAIQGGVQVGEERVAANGRALDAAQDRAERRLQAPGAIGGPTILVAGWSASWVIANTSRCCRSCRRSTRHRDRWHRSSVTSV